jgi:hypothetical protein
LISADFSIVTYTVMPRNLHCAQLVSSDFVIFECSFCHFSAQILPFFSTKFWGVWIVYMYMLFWRMKHFPFKSLGFQKINHKKTAIADTCTSWSFGITYILKCHFVIQNNCILGWVIFYVWPFGTLLVATCTCNFYHCIQNGYHILFIIVFISKACYDFWLQFLH